MARKAITRKVVISFRVTDEIEGALADIIKQNPDGIMGVKSTRTLARRIVIDYARGRVAYKNKEDFAEDREIMAVANAEAAALKGGDQAKGGRKAKAKAVKAKAKVAKTVKADSATARVRKAS